MARGLTRPATMALAERSAKRAGTRDMTEDGTRRTHTHTPWKAARHVPTHFAMLAGVSALLRGARRRGRRWHSSSGNSGNAFPASGEAPVTVPLDGASTGPLGLRDFITPLLGPRAGAHGAGAACDPSPIAVARGGNAGHARWASNGERPLSVYVETYGCQVRWGPYLLPIHWFTYVRGACPVRSR